MKIGLPCAFLQHKYGALWQEYFTRLGFEVLLSPPTTKALMQRGLECAVDESCLPAKIFLGHVEYLIDRCDCIFVPRLDNFGKNELVCVKFNALYDIVQNTFPSARLITCNIDATHGSGEFAAFMRLGRSLGANPLRTLRAYNLAKRAQGEHELRLENRQKGLLFSNKTKILIVAHPYNIGDRLVGEPIVKILEGLGVQPLFAHHCNPKAARQASKKYSSSLYWTFNKELIGAVALLEDKIDGVIFLTAFPCGPDSLVSELVMRRLSLPKINLVVDELTAQAGMETRLESFVDILQQKKLDLG